MGKYAAAARGLNKNKNEENKSTSSVKYAGSAAASGKQESEKSFNTRLKQETKNLYGQTTGNARGAGTSYTRSAGGATSSPASTPVSTQLQGSLYAQVAKQMQSGPSRTPAPTYSQPGSLYAPAARQPAAMPGLTGAQRQMIAERNTAPTMTYSQILQRNMQAARQGSVTPDMVAELEEAGRREREERQERLRQLNEDIYAASESLYTPQVQMTTPDRRELSNGVTDGMGISDVKAALPGLQESFEYARDRYQRLMDRNIRMANETGAVSPEMVAELRQAERDKNEADRRYQDALARNEQMSYSERMGSLQTDVGGIAELLAQREAVNRNGFAGMGGQNNRGMDESRQQLAAIDARIEAVRESLRREGLSEDEIQSLFDYQVRLKNAEDTEALYQRYLAEAQGNTSFENWVMNTSMGLYSGASYIDLLAQGASGLIRGADPITGQARRIDYNSELQGFQHSGEAVMQGEMDKLLAKYGVKDENGEITGMSREGRIRAGAYQLAVSMGQSAAVAGLTAVGAPCAMLLLSGSAATSTAHEMHERGFSDGASLLMGGIAGAAEYVTEKIGMDQLFKTRDISTAKNVLKTALQNFVNQSLAEGGEEVLSTVINTLADVIVNGDKSELESRYRELMAQGMTSDQAQKIAAREWLSGVWNDFYMGAISGGLFSVGGMTFQTGRNAIVDSRTGRKIADANVLDQLIEQINTLDGDIAEAANVPESFNPRNNREVGSAARAMERAQVMENMRAELEARGEENVSPELLSGMYASSQQEPQRLTGEERKALRGSETAMELVREWSDQWGDNSVPAPFEGLEDILRTQMEQKENAPQEGATEEGVIHGEQGIDGTSENGNDGVRAGEQGTGIPELGEEGAVPGGEGQVRESVSEGRGENLRSVTLRELGVTNAAEDATIQVQDEQSLTGDAARAAQQVRQQGLEPVAFRGEMIVNGASVNGYIENGRVFFRTDAKYRDGTPISSESIVRHESVHNAKDSDPGIIDIGMEIVRQNRSEAEVLEMMDAYRETYKDLYDFEKMSEEDITDMLVEEIVADAYAGMNYFRDGGETVEQVRAAIGNQVESAQSIEGQTESTGPPRALAAMKKQFDSEVDEIVYSDDNKPFVYKNVVMRNTPKVLLDFGFSQLPMTITSKHIYTIANKDGRFSENDVHYHNLGAEGVKSLFDEIENPIFAYVEQMPDKNKPARIVMVIPMADGSGNPVMVAVECAGNTEINEVHVIANPVTTALGKKESSLTKLINKALEEGRLLFANKERSQYLPADTGSNLPNDLEGSPNDNLWKDIPKELWSYDFTNNVQRFRDAVKRFQPNRKRIEKAWKTANNSGRASAEVTPRASTEERKQKQVELILKNNPHDDSLGEHTWIRSAEDVHTYEEGLAEDGIEAGDNVAPDYTAGMIEEAKRTGQITVYSSHQIGTGTFVTPSAMEAKSYAGDGPIYSKTIPTEDVAWLDSIQGQYAPVNGPGRASAEVTKRSQKQDNFTDAELQQTRSIGKKSVYSLNSAELQNLQKVAGIYWRDLGNKSPFFRAWFGDWRANDQTPIKIVDTQGSTTGAFTNADTGWTINASGQVRNETKVQNALTSKAAIPYLPYIENIIKNAVLLDSWGIGKAKSPNSLMMHSLYAVADNGSGPAVIKMLVEEMNNPNIEGTGKRAYQLQNIEVYRQPGVRVQGQNNSSPIPITQTANIQNVADLFQVVKALDPDFNPTTTSVVTDAQGMPTIVYPVSEDTGEYRFSEEGEGEEHYLRMENPYTIHGEISEEIDPTIVQTAKRSGHDGIIIEDQQGNRAYVVFNQEQAKSATDNVGTFDKSNPDRRFSAEVQPREDKQDNKERREALRAQAEAMTAHRNGRGIDIMPGEGAESISSANGLTEADNADLDARNPAPGDGFDASVLFGPTNTEQEARATEKATKEGNDALARFAEEMPDDPMDLYQEQNPVNARKGGDDGNGPRYQPGYEKMSTEKAAEKKTLWQKISEGWHRLLRSMVNEADAIHQAGRQTGNKALDGMYFYAKAATQRAQQWIQGQRMNFDLSESGKGLNAIFDPIRAKGDEYYKNFQLYMYHMLNVERMSRSTADALERAQQRVNELAAVDPSIATMSDEQLRNRARQYQEQGGLGYEDDNRGELIYQYWQALQERDRAEKAQNKPVFGYDMDADQSREIARDLLAAHPEFEDLAQDVYDYVDALLQYRVDSGLITAEDMNRLKEMYPHYIPVMYKMTEEEVDDRHRKGNIQTDDAIKKAKGGDREMEPLHLALARQTLAVMKNAGYQQLGSEVLNEFRNNAETMGRYVTNVEEYESAWDESLADNDDVNVPYENVISVFQDGKRYDLTLSDDMSYAFQSLQPSRQGNQDWKLMMKGNDLFKKLCTAYNPLFMITNPIRDVQDALFYSTDTKRWLRNYPRAIAQIAGNGRFWQMYQAMGGVNNSYFDWATGENSGKMGRIEALNMAIEQAPRLAEYMTVLENAQRNNGEVTQADRMEAFNAAAEITTNFSRGGTLGKWINRNLVPFWNPGVQGLSKAVRTVTETRGFKAWAGLTMKAAALGMVPALLNGLLYRDDDEWDTIDDQLKMEYYLFKTSDGVWIKVPKGRVLAALSMPVIGAQESLRGDEVDWKELTMQAFGSVAPNNPLETNLLSTAVQAKLFDADDPGKTWYGGDIESRRLQGYAPGERYDESTDVLSKWLGKQLNISPKKINYVIDQYSGILGDLVLPYLTPRAERGISAEIAGHDVSVPLSNAFMSRFTLDTVTNNTISGEYYDMLDELGFNAKSGDNPAAIAERYMNRAGSTVSDIYAQIREIENDTELTDREKTQLTRELRKQLNEYEKQVIEDAGKYLTSAREYMDDHPEFDYSDDGAVDAFVEGYNSMQTNEKYFIDAEQAAGKMKDEVYREVNREHFGAEYALQVYNKDVYEKARTVHDDSGLSYEDYYDYYFGTRYLFGDKDAEGNTIAGSRTDKVVNFLEGMDITDEQRNALYHAADHTWNYPTGITEYLKEHLEYDFMDSQAVNAFVEGYNAQQSSEKYYIDAAGAKSKMRSEAYREIYREQYGAEYALEFFDKDVYEKAQELNTSAGLSYDDYYDFYFGTRYMYADKDENGNSISGSKKEKVVGFINDMDVSDAEKDALYLAAGYKENTLKTTPWNGGSGQYSSGGRSGGRGGRSSKTKAPKTKAVKGSGKIQLPKVSSGSGSKAASGRSGAGRAGGNADASLSLIQIIDRYYGGNALAAAMDGGARARGRTTVDFEV